jgi:hypothetical protein
LKQSLVISIVEHVINARLLLIIALTCAALAHITIVYRCGHIADERRELVELHLHWR